MLLKSNDSSLVRKYTVDNKNIPNLERVLKRKVWQNRTIQLYTKKDWEFYFPNWAKQFIKWEETKKERLDVYFNGELDDAQKKALRHIMMNWGGLIDMKTWGWKCYGKWEQVICFSGEKKNVEEIVVWDLLMWPDSKERVVVATTKWLDMLYEIKTVKWEKMVVTWNHILVLRCSYNYRWLWWKTYKQWEIVKMTVLEYLDLLSKYKKTWHIFKLFKPDLIDFEEKKVHIEPYVLWLWLWDWNKHNFWISTMDGEVVDCIYKYAEKTWQTVNINHNKNKTCPTYTITKWYKWHHNLFCAKDLLREYELLNNKHIPKDYLFNSKNNRLQLLAWLIDTDWYLWENKSLTFNNTNENIIDWVVFLCNSLWLAAYKRRRITKSQHWKKCVSWNVSISWNIEDIPCKVKRRIATERKQQKNVKNHWFTIKEKWIWEYFWFELDWDRLHLNNDFFVCHNSYLTMWIINLYKYRTLIIVPTTKLLVEMQEKIKKLMDYDCGVFYWLKKDVKDITVTTHKSFVENDLWEFPCIIVDECDTNLSRSMIDKLNLSNVDILVWMTWTPTRIELDTKDLELFFWPYLQCWWYKEVPTEAIQYVYRRNNAEKNLYVWDSFAETRTAILQNETRLNKIVEKCLEIKSKYNIMLILTDRIEECEILQSLMPDSVVINWGTKLKHDNEHIERIRNSWWIIIGTRQKMGRWVDVPEIDCVALVWAFKFKSAVIQAIWRALRKFEWKNDIGVYVFSDDIMRWQMYENKKTLETEYKIQVSRQFLN